MCICLRYKYVIVLTVQHAQTHACVYSVSIMVSSNGTPHRYQRFPPHARRHDLLSVSGALVLLIDWPLRDGAVA
jgi:hypothetical protein